MAWPQAQCTGQNLVLIVGWCHDSSAPGGKQAAATGQLASTGERCGVGEVQGRPPLPAPQSSPLGCHPTPSRPRPQCPAGLTWRRAPVTASSIWWHPWCPAMPCLQGYKWPLGVRALRSSFFPGCLLAWTGTTETLLGVGPTPGYSGAREEWVTTPEGVCGRFLKLPSPHLASSIKIQSSELQFHGTTFTS